ncbi:hypothetical protein OIV19_14700 [Brucella sp. HL-2]|nr:hypothetical protein [Brucella sp. HL-2]MCV9908860.1 hypothetical protein [Brucella sp. HL-2]
MQPLTPTRILSENRFALFGMRYSISPNKAVSTAMSSSLSSLESAAKYLSQSDKDQFFKIKREMEASGASRASIEERLHAFIWQVIEADDEDESENEE